MSLTTQLLDVKRIIAELLNHLTKPLRERLLFLRRTNPGTPLHSLPKPIRTEVKTILTSAGATTATPSPSNRPSLPKGQQQTTPNGTPPPSRPGSMRTTDVSILGTDTTGREIGITQQQRRQGLYVIGTNGTGKTTLLENMILRDIHANKGIALIEPHGDLTAKILGGIPRQRINDVYYLDVEDWEFPFGLGLFEVPHPRTIRTLAATASFISHTFETIFSVGTADTPRLMQNLRATTRTLLSNPGSSFADIPLLYANPQVRATMLEAVDNQQILHYWENYERMNHRDRQAYTESTLNKVTTFLDEPMIQHILAQAKTTIPFRYIMDHSKIMLIKLSPQFEEASRLIGAVIIGKILMTAFSRSDTPEEKRRDFAIYCDEFHRFASSDFATLIAEARKFRISTTIAHQTLNQLSEQNKASALGSGNIICFRASGDDAHVLCRSFDTTPTPQIIINGEEPVRSPTTDPITHLVTRGHQDSRVARFATYLTNLEHYLKTPSSPSVAYVKEWDAAYYSGSYASLILYERHLHEGRKLLNECLYASMSEANPTVSIPMLAIYILAAAQRDGREYVLRPYVKHFNHGFLFGPFSLKAFEESAAKFGRPQFTKPQQAARYIASVARYAKKEKWMAEAVVSMLTELRYVLTVLSQSQILIDTGQYRPRLQTHIQTFQDRENQIARDLANAQNYTCRVKLVSGGEYVIRTTPPQETLTGDALAERIQAIKAHMQALGVIRHYTEVERDMKARQERLLDAPEDTDEPPPADAFSLE